MELTIVTTTPLKSKAANGLSVFARQNAAGWKTRLPGEVSSP
jgi:hypothetical protein